MTGYEPRPLRHSDQDTLSRWPLSRSCRGYGQSTPRGLSLSGEIFREIHSKNADITIHVDEMALCHRLNLPCDQNTHGSSQIIWLVELRSIANVVAANSIMSKRYGSWQNGMDGNGVSHVSSKAHSERAVEWLGHRDKHVPALSLLAAHYSPQTYSANTHCN